MRALALVFALLLAVAAPAQISSTQSAPKSARAHEIVFWNMSRGSVDLLLNHVPQTNAHRLAQLRQVFTDLQCSGPQLREKPFPGGSAGSTNLICALPGNAPAAKHGASPPAGTFPESGTILFVAYYEHEGLGRSVVDDWSGALMLPFVYHALSAAPRRHTFLFAEVDGRAGAKALFDSFTLQQRSDIHGVIALDALGLGPAQFHINPNDTSSYYAWKWLYGPLLHAAADQRIDPPGNAILGAWLKVDVTREFRHHNIPSMLIHSVGWHQREIPGSIHDTAAVIDRDTYFQTITLLSVFAAELDEEGAVR